MTNPGPDRARVFTLQQPVLALALLAMLTVFSAPVDAADSFAATGEPISLRLEDAELADVLRSFSKISHLNFVVVPEVNRYDLLNQTVSAAFESTPWDEVLNEILSNAGLAWTHEGSVLWIHPPSDPPDGDRNFTGDPITLNLEGADLRKVIKVFSAQTGHVFELDPAVEAEVTVNLEDVPWDQALELILRISGLTYSLSNGVFEIYPVTDARGMQLLSVRKRSPEGRFEGERVLHYKKN
jgi:type II secretory pathway component HofQ